MDMNNIFKYIPINRVIDKNLMVGKEIQRGKDGVIYEYKNNKNKIIKECSNLKEYTYLTNLHHENIIKPIDWFVDISEINYLLDESESEEEITEYITYYIIYPRLEKLSNIPNIYQIEELVDAICFLLKNNIHHNDIHIDNIMELNGRLILIDFGRSLYLSDINKIEKAKTVNIFNLCVSIIYYIINYSLNHDPNIIAYNSFVNTTNFIDDTDEIDKINKIYAYLKQTNFVELGELGQYLFNLMYN